MSLSEHAFFLNMWSFSEYSVQQNGLFQGNLLSGTKFTQLGVVLTATVSKWQFFSWFELNFWGMNLEQYAT